MNDQGILAWEADSVAFNTFTINVEIAFDVDVDDSEYINDFYSGTDDSYSTRWTASGTLSKEYTFTRETLKVNSLTTAYPGPETFNPGDITANKFQIGNGFTKIGSPLASTPPFFRSCKAVFFSNGNVTNATPAQLAVDDTEPWTVNYTGTYTRVGPEVDPDALPDDIDEDLDLYVKLTLNLLFSGTTPTWYMTVVLVDATGGAGSPVFFTPNVNGWPGGETSVLSFLIPAMSKSKAGPAIDVCSLKVASGGATDFGVADSQDNAGSYDPELFTVTTNTATTDVTITVS